MCPRPRTLSQELEPHVSIRAHIAHLKTIHNRQKRELLQLAPTDPASEQALLQCCNGKNFEDFRHAHIHCIGEIMAQR
jgi:hypothetical protein